MIFGVGMYLGLPRTLLILLVGGVVWCCLIVVFELGSCYPIPSTGCSDRMIGLCGCKLVAGMGTRVGVRVGGRPSETMVVGDAR